MEAAKKAQTMANNISDASMKQLFRLAVLALAVCITPQNGVEAQTQFIYGLCNVNKYEKGTQFASAVDSVIQTLIDYSGSGFALAEIGEVKGLLQCRGDVSPSDCRTCAEAVASAIRSRCPNAVGAKIQLEYCFLRYENYSFANVLDNSVVSALVNVNNSSDIAGFGSALNGLLEALRNGAPLSPKRFAAARRDVSSSMTLYALQQCLRSVSADDCRDCLSKALTENDRCCASRVGAQVYLGSCSLRYEIYPFFAAYS